MKTLQQPIEIFELVTYGMGLANEHMRLVTQACEKVQTLEQLSAVHEYTDAVVDELEAIFERLQEIKRQRRAFIALLHCESPRIVIAGLRSFSVD